MTLETLLNIHGHLHWGSQDPKAIATNLVFDSRQVQAGDVFVAIRGSSGDGHDYLEKVVAVKPAALVVEDKAHIPTSYKGAVVEVLDTRLSLQVLAQRLFAEPGEQMQAIAVTGTNGKSSTTYIVEHILNQQSVDCGVIGTIDHHLREQVWKTQLTTPDPVTLQSRLKDFVDHGAKAFVIEASSHALHQSRIRQGFDLAIFTNLSRDHLDYHKTMEDYFQAKAILFSRAYLKDSGQAVAAINTDDEYGKRLVEITEGRRVLSFGQGQEANFRFSIEKANIEGQKVQLTGPDGLELSFFHPLIGEHNTYNIVGVLVGLYALGYDFSQMTESLKSFSGIPGRLQHLQSKDQVHVFVDYAHTPDALAQAASALRSGMTGSVKLTTVFGCGGDRDQGKRPQMGKVAQELSHRVVVTSDNPRSEDPDSIIDDIMAGLQPSVDVHRQVDRSAAIESAVKMSQPGDVVLVAGKGHEDYQILADRTISLSDIEIAEKALKGRG